MKNMKLNPTLLLPKTFHGHNLKNIYNYIYEHYKYNRFLFTIIPLGSFIYVGLILLIPKSEKPNFNNITKLVIISSICKTCIEYAFKMPSYYIFD